MKPIDERAILEVAREIRNDAVRGKYLSQVCDDPAARLGLERRVKLRRRWQFGLRTLLVLMVMAAVASTFIGISYNRALEARRLAERARLQAMQAAEQARAALQQQRRVEPSGDDKP